MILRVSSSVCLLGKHSCNPCSGGALCSEVPPCSLAPFLGPLPDPFLPHLPRPLSGAWGIAVETSPLFPDSPVHSPSARAHSLSQAFLLTKWNPHPVALRRRQGRGQRAMPRLLSASERPVVRLDQEAHLTQSQGGGKSISVIIPLSVWKPQMST